MGSRNFRELIENQWAQDKFVCIGLDPDLDKLPVSIRVFCGRDGQVDAERAILALNYRIIEATKDLAGAYMPNIAFYERFGSAGIRALRRTIQYIHLNAPDVPVILDYKRADIGDSNCGYVELAFNYLGVDAITVNLYSGGQALEPFLAHKDKGIFVLCRTSNPGAGELQDLEIHRPGKLGTCSLASYVAHRTCHHWNLNENCGLIVGSNVAEVISAIRGEVGDLMILFPDCCAEGGDLRTTVHHGMNKRGNGILINPSRAVLFASPSEDFAQAVRTKTLEFHALINAYRDSRNNFANE